MKHIRILSMLLLVFLVLTSLPMAVSASEGAAREDVEVVLLFDVSGSMKDSDPEFLSVLAASSFVAGAPKDCNTYVTVVPYNSTVYSGFKRVNVATEDGLEEFNRQLMMMMGNTIPGFSCWETNTNTGEALEVAKGKLASATAKNKTVILFTDGKIELTSADSITTDASVTKAMESSAAIKAEGHHIYSIGLKCGEKFDKNQLVAISGEDDVRVVTSAEGLATMFDEVYGELYGVLPDEDPEKFEVDPVVPVEYSVKVFDQTVKEANIALRSEAPLYTIEVVSPSGVTVADVDLRNDPIGTVNGRYCSVQPAVMNRYATIKLLEPKGGDWKIYVTGQAGTVIASEIYFYDLEAKTNITATEHYIGDTFSFSAALYNSESGIQITAADIYSGEGGAKAVASIKNNGISGQDIVAGTLKASRNGYDFVYDFSMVGEYTVAVDISHSQFEESVENTITVLGPAVGADAVQNGDNYDVTVKFTHPVTGDDLTVVPDYLSGEKVKVTVKCDDAVVEEKEYDISSFTEGKYQFTYDPSASGKYEFLVSYSSGGNTVGGGSGSVDHEEPLPPEPPKPEIVVEGELPKEFYEKGFSGEFSETVSLDGIYKLINSENTLSYEIEIDGDNVFSAELEDKEIEIECDGFGEATLIITVTDGDGLTVTHEISLVSESSWPIVIIIVVVVLVLIVLVIVAILVIKKKKIISIAFRFKIEDRSRNAFSASYAVYNVSRLSNKKNAKPTMTLAQILNSNGYAQMDAGATMSVEEIGAFMAQFGGNISLTGIPFKRAFKIEYKDAAGKVRNYKFTSSNVVVRLNDNCDITFGNSHANF